MDDLIARLEHLGLVWADELAAKAAAALRASAERERELVEGLRRIAAYDDEGACDFLARTGSYMAFDEPKSVVMARAILEKHKSATDMAMPPCDTPIPSPAKTFPTNEEKD